ncbi:PAS and ANTAR domain-containing protein [Nocardia heshunensis]
MTDDGGDTGSDEQVVRELEQVVAAGSPQGVGWFRFCFDDQRWEWSDDMARMHGYEPGEVEPTTELLLSHKHPEDRDRVEAEFVSSVRDHAPFSSRHRIVDTAGGEHQVVVVSAAITDESNAVVGTEGYFVDITDAIVEERGEAIRAVIPDLMQDRALIEQAKGALMLAYGVTAEQAFRVLRWRSQETNTKLRALATQIVRELHAVPTPGLPVRTAFDHLILTVHQRIPAPE